MSYQIQQENYANTQSIIADGLRIAEILAGDQSSFEALVKKYEGPLRGYIWRILKDEEIMADVLQYVFLQLYLFLPKLNTSRSLQPWLFRVAYCRCLDELRKKKSRPVISFSQLEKENDGSELTFAELIPDERPIPEDIFEQQELHEQLLCVLSVLPPSIQVIVHLHCFGELTFSEIGKQLNIPATTAKTYFYRSLPRLRAALQGEPIEKTRKKSAKVLCVS